MKQKNFHVKFKINNKQKLKDKGEKLFPNCVIVVLNLIKDLENEWLDKTKNNKNIFKSNILKNIFSLLKNQILLFQQISDITFDNCMKIDIDNFINLSKTKISQKIEQILKIINEANEIKLSSSDLINNTNNEINNNSNYNSNNNINYIYKKNSDKNHFFKFKKNASLDLESCSNSKKSKLISKTENNNKGNNIIIKTFSNSRNNIKTNNPNLLNKKSFNCNNNIINKCLSSSSDNQTYNENNYCKKRSVDDIFENPITKIKNIIIKAKKDKNISLSVDFKPINNLNNNNNNITNSNANGNKYCKKNYGSINCSTANITNNNSRNYETINNDSISKIGIKKTFFKNINFKNIKIDNLKNNINEHNKSNKNQDDDKNKKIIIKVGKKKDRETKQILYDGMKKIKNKLNSKENNYKKVK